MTDCHWGANDRRVLRGRHDPACADTTCRGCQACSERHCLRCGVTHEEHVCPGCLLATKLDLAEIVEACATLASEVADHGIDSEVMMLISPCADPEARGHLEASVAFGRVGPDRLDDLLPRNEMHPLWVLETIAMDWRAALDHDDPTTVVTVPDSAGYLIRNLEHVARKSAVDIHEQANEIAACSNNLGRVLQTWRAKHKGAPCIHCNDGTLLEHQTRDDETLDGWWCPRCRFEWDEDGYREVVRVANLVRAEWLTAPECSTLTKVPIGSVWGWASKNLVARKESGGRTLYRVADIRAQVKTDDGGVALASEAL